MTELHQMAFAQQAQKQVDDSVIRYVIELSFRIDGVPAATFMDEVERLVRQFGGATGDDAGCGDRPIRLSAGVSQR